jgi:hypothetical protein
MRQVHTTKLAFSDRDFAAAARVLRKRRFEGRTEIEIFCQEFLKLCTDAIRFDHLFRLLDTLRR